LRVGLVQGLAMSLATLSDIEQRALGELASCSDEAALRAWHIRYFGKQGEVVLALKGVGAVPPDQRKAYGQQANQVKEALTAAYETAIAAMKERDLARSLAEDRVDVTLPGRP